MTTRSFLIVLHTFMIVFHLGSSEEISYNRPNLSSCAEWNSNGTTVISRASSMFIDRNNIIYTTDWDKTYLLEWTNGSDNLPRISSNSLIKLGEFFITTTGDAYVIGDGTINKVFKWTLMTNTIQNVAEFCSNFLRIYIFIASNDMIYYSLSFFDQVVAKSLNRNHSTMITLIAGVGIRGSESYMLSNPAGIFVTANLDLFVADSYNHRIQFFRSGEINGETIADSLAPYNLRFPQTVVLDGNENIYIADSGNARIVVKTVNGFRCLFGCIADNGADSAETKGTLTFDTFGNIYFINSNGDRVQKYSLSSNICNFTNNTEMNRTSTIITSTSTTPVLIESRYTSKLTTNHPTYMKDCNNPIHYYESIQIHVFKQGNYKFFINSTVEIYVDLYKNDFKPDKPDFNHFIRLGEYCHVINQIKFIAYLQPTETYELIVATNSPDSMSSFYVTVNGPSQISSTRKNDSIVVQTIYQSAFTENSQKCPQASCIPLDYYCEAIEVYVQETGYYIIRSNSTRPMRGYIYENNFTLFDTWMNAIEKGLGNDCNGQFRIFLHRQMNTSFILIATNDPGKSSSFSITVDGPSNVSMKPIDHFPPTIQSNYSSELTTNSSKHAHENQFHLESYYEAIQLTVNTSGYYMLSSKSDFNCDAVGYLYEHYFDPYNPHPTLIKKNHDACGEGEFKITSYLQFGVTYVLIVTTGNMRSCATGAFSVIALGPDEIQMKFIDNIPPIFESEYKSEWTVNCSRFNYNDCRFPLYCYAAIQINVIQSGNYTLAVYGFTDMVEILYAQHFNPYKPTDRLIYYSNEHCHSESTSGRKVTYLKSHDTYVIVVSTCGQIAEHYFKIDLLGPNNVTFNRITLRGTYTSELTKETQVYPRVCGQGNYHYETIQVKVEQNGSYAFDGNNSILLYGYLYEHDFDPSYPNENLITQSNFTCGKHFHVGAYLQINTIYILVVTTFDPNIKGSFTLRAIGPNNITLDRIVKEQSSCVIGDQCNLFTKAIGLTINDILRNQIQSNTPLIKQSILIQVAAAITMIMFIVGLINGAFSFITFKNKELRNVGCGIYLFASSITSLSTVTIFTIKFWFAVLIQMHSTVRSSILRTDCLFLGPFLKLCLYLDGWLNACIAIERTVNVSKGVTFNKKMSRHMARYIIVILPILIMSTIIHEPIQHEIFEYPIQKYVLIENNNSTMNESSEYEPIIEHRAICIIRYSRSLQTYNTVTLFLHLIVPFVANLSSAIFIIFGTARQRATIQKNQTFKEHTIKQMSEHKQLLISPLILLILTIPRIILSLVSGCVDPSSNPWLYLCAYFISYIPPMLVFAVFVLPSELYMKTFKDSMTRWSRQ